MRLEKRCEIFLSIDAKFYQTYPDSVDVTLFQKPSHTCNYRKVSKEFMWLQLRAFSVPAIFQEETIL